MPENSDELRENPQHWKYGIIYRCAKDPRIVVPKRRRWTGWTFNFAHRTAYLLVLVIILAAVVPCISVVRDGQPHRIPEMLLLSVVFIIVLIIATAKVGRH